MFPEDIWVRVALSSSVLMSSYRGHSFKTCSSSSIIGLCSPGSSKMSSNVSRSVHVGQHLLCLLLYFAPYLPASMLSP